MLHGFAGSGLLDGSWGHVQGAASLVSVLNQLRGKESIETPYWQDPWVFAPIHRIAEAAASARPRFFRDRSPDAEPVSDDDPIYEFFRRPNPTLSYGRFIRHLTTLWWVYGELPLVLRRGSGQDWITSPGEVDLASLATAKRRDRINVFPLKPDCAELLFDKDGAPEWWKVQTAGPQNYVEIPVDAVAHIFSPDPMDVLFLRGMGRLEAVLRTCEIDWQAERYAEASIRTGGVPNIVILAAGATEDQVKKLKDDVQKNHQAPINQGKAMVLGGKDPKVEFPGHTPTEMAFEALRRWDRETKIAALGGNPAWLGITDDVNRANAEQGRKSAWEDTISPWLETLAAEIENELLPMLGEQYAEMGFEFDTSHVKALREDENEQSARAKLFFDTFPVTMREAFDLAGMELPEDIEGADERKPEPEPVQPGVPKKQAVDLNEFPIGRAAASQQFLDQTMAPELKIRKLTTRVFGAYIDKALALARDTAAEGKTFAWRVQHDSSPLSIEVLLPEILPWQTRLWDAVGPVERSIFDAQARYIAQALGVEPLLGAGTPAAQAFLARKEIALKETLVTLREAVRGALENALADSDAVGSVADQIRQALELYRADLKIMQDNLGARAELIARTETTSIANSARMMEAEAQGVTEMRWITARDANVRESHQELDGEVRQLGQEFGSGLRWPGDPQADVSEIANCRCTVAPTTRGVGKAA